MEEITDNQVLGSLLAEETVQGFTIKPWTVKQLLLVMPILDRMVEALQSQGITLDNLGEILESRGLAAAKDLVQAILPQLPEFLAVSLRIDREAAEELDLGLALQLGVKVMGMNLDHLKNAGGLIRDQVEILVRPKGTL